MNLLIPSRTKDLASYCEQLKDELAEAVRRRDAAELESAKVKAKLEATQAVAMEYTRRMQAMGDIATELQWRREGILAARDHLDEVRELLNSMLD